MNAFFFFGSIKNEYLTHTGINTIGSIFNECGWEPEKKIKFGENENENKHEAIMKEKKNIQKQYVEISSQSYESSSPIEP